MKALLDHFGLRELPFGVTPDPRFLYFSGTHRETLATLRYGVEMNRGFMALIAEPGMGKTTLLFHLLESMRGAARTSFVFNTQRSAQDLVRALIHDAGVETKHLDSVELFESFHSLLAQESRAGKQVLLVIDEAQNLGHEALEAVRLLSNFETSRTKLLQIILAGQPQLKTKLSDGSLAQLRQRLSLICRLKPFTADDVSRYVEHRLRVAGCATPLFSPDALALIAQHTGGVPRNISNLCFHAMSIAFALDRHLVESTMVVEALNDLSLDTEQIPVPDHDPSAEMIPISPAKNIFAPAIVANVGGNKAEPPSSVANEAPAAERSHRKVHRGVGTAGPTYTRHVVFAAVAAVLLLALVNSDLFTAVQAGSIGNAVQVQRGTILPAVAIERLKPQYPAAAVRDKIEGVVVVRAYIEKDGSVKDVSTVSGPETLTKTAVAAVRKWRFQPAMQNGSPVPYEQEVRFDFHLNRGAKHDE
jgi:general secretion pathway protein A